MLNLIGVTYRSRDCKWLWGKGLGYIKPHRAKIALSASPHPSVSSPEGEI